jgi:prepilin-type N-terminal cleavage/methylation domain-containing protein
MRNFSNRGFTLIELLVVIAIIGVLSSVVLSSLNQARNKGANASTKTNLHNARGQAELFYANNNDSYSNICSATTQLAADGVTKNIYNFVSSAAQSAGVSLSTTAATPASPTQAVCHYNGAGTLWAAEVPLKTPETGYWCVDSTGFSGTRVNIVAGSGAYQYACPAS